RRSARRWQLRWARQRGTLELRWGTLVEQLRRTRARRWVTLALQRDTLEQLRVTVESQQGKPERQWVRLELQRAAPRQGKLELQRVRLELQRAAPRQGKPERQRVRLGLQRAAPRRDRLERQRAEPRRGRRWGAGRGEGPRG